MCLTYFDTNHANHANTHAGNKESMLNDLLSTKHFKNLIPPELH